MYTSAGASTFVDRLGLPRALLTEAAFLDHPPAGGGRPPPRGLSRRIALEVGPGHERRAAGQRNPPDVPMPRGRQRLLTHLVVCGRGRDPTARLSTCYRPAPLLPEPTRIDQNGEHAARAAAPGPPTLRPTHLQELLGRSGVRRQVGGPSWPADLPPRLVLLAEFLLMNPVVFGRSVGGEARLEWQQPSDACGARNQP